MCSEKDKEYVSLKYGINTDYFLGDDNDDDESVIPLPICLSSPLMREDI